MKKFSFSNSADHRFYVGLFLSIVFCAGFFMFGTADSVSAQSLVIAKEKKEIDKTIPQYKQEIIEKCGDFKFEMEVDYDSFTAIPERVTLVGNQGLLQVRNALRRVCTDSSDTSARSEEAAAAVRSKIKRIVLTNIADPKKKNIELTKDGVLYVRNSYTEPGGIVDYVAMATQLLKIL
ncbi:MAG: hypothetical protein ABI891_14615 [Acidobacteriota bacterium]